jgi:hypothetical protein
MTGDNPYDGSDTRARALERVNAASTERSRLHSEHQRAKGTSSEMRADKSLRAANEEVAARERWLQWVEERDY